MRSISSLKPEWRKTMPLFSLQAPTGRCVGPAGTICSLTAMVLQKPPKGTYTHSSPRDVLSHAPALQFRTLGYTQSHCLPEEKQFSYYVLNNEHHTFNGAVIVNGGLKDWWKAISEESVVLRKPCASKKLVWKTLFLKNSKCLTKVLCKIIKHSGLGLGKFCFFTLCTWSLCVEWTHTWILYLWLNLINLLLISRNYLP